MHTKPTTLPRIAKLAKNKEYLQEQEGIALGVAGSLSMLLFYLYREGIKLLSLPDLCTHRQKKKNAQKTSPSSEKKNPAYERETACVKTGNTRKGTPVMKRAGFSSAKSSEPAPDYGRIQMFCKYMKLSHSEADH